MDVPYVHRMENPGDAALTINVRRHPRYSPRQYNIINIVAERYPIMLVAIANKSTEYGCPHASDIQTTTEC